MNVVKIAVDVLKSATTLLGHTCAAVTLAIVSATIITLVKVCMPVLSSYVCLKNFTSDQSISIDLDECFLNADNCMQTCNNTIGSFECGCIPGYQLNNDSTTCRGMSLMI